MSTQPEGSSPSAPPPSEVLVRMSMGTHVSQALAVAARLRIGDLLQGEPRTADELAVATNTHAPSLRRLLRALTSVGVLAEDAAGRFALTPLGAPLRSDAPDSVRAWVELVGRPYHRHTWTELIYSVQTGQPALDHVLGMGAFEYFQAHPEVGEQFNNAMTDISRLAEPGVVRGYPFAALTAGESGAAPLIVDVGGGHGALLAGILRAYPGLRGMLFDQPPVVAGAGQVLAAAGVADRCTVVGGDFFEGVPAGGDAYLMKNIIHDWDDARATTILQHCRRAISPGGKLLLVELLLPPPNTESFAPWADLEMLVMTPGGRERTESEYAALFTAAGFRLSRVVPTESPFSVIEGVPAD
jgi:SAM-dependent methyltransferase